MNKHLVILFASVLLLLGGGCNDGGRMGPAWGGEGGEDDNRPQITQEELRLALEDFDGYFEQVIKQAAIELDEHLTGRDSRRKTLLWRVRMLPACNLALGNEDPRQAFLDVWLLSVRMQHYLSEGEGADLFGQHQQIAVTAAERIERQIEQVGRLFLSEEKLATTREAMYALARKNPMHDIFTNVSLRPVEPTDSRKDVFASIVKIPLVPFRVFEGIDRGAEAIHGFTAVAGRFTDVVEEMPEAVRWQLQLFMLEMETNPLISTTVESMKQVSSSSSRLATTAQDLPEQLRREATELLDQIDSRQENLQATLRQAQATSESIQQSLERVQAASVTLEQTAASVSEAGRAWEHTARTVGTTIEQIRGPQDQDVGRSVGGKQPVEAGEAVAGDESGGDDFDIEQYRSTAEALAEAARELGTTTVEVRQLIESRQLDETIQDVDHRVKGVVGETSVLTRHLLDHLAWRGAQLIGLVFILGVVYRLVSSRVLKRAG